MNVPNTSGVPGKIWIAVGLLNFLALFWPVILSSARGRRWSASRADIAIRRDLPWAVLMCRGFVPVVSGGFLFAAAGDIAVLWNPSSGPLFVAEVIGFLGVSVCVILLFTTAYFGRPRILVLAQYRALGLSASAEENAATLSPAGADMSGSSSSAGENE